FLAEAGVAACHWYLDRPISNSGRLRRILLDLSVAKDWHWEVELVDDPDRILATAPTPVATADSAILDRCTAWVNLAAETIRDRVPQARLIDLGNAVRGS